MGKHIYKTCLFKAEGFCNIMKITTPEINWHNRGDPVYGVDFCPKPVGPTTFLLATCGTDAFVRLWTADHAGTAEGAEPQPPPPPKPKERTPTKEKNSKKDGKDPKDLEPPSPCLENGLELNFRATLVRHTKAVNVVRFSPDGLVLASAGDDSVICLWRRSKEKPSMVREEEEYNEEFWAVFKSLRGHLDDIYDLSWSQNGLNIISGSIDNSAIVWNAKTGEKLSILRDHKGLVQGVGWDPRNVVIATLSTDRCLRFYNVDKKFKCAATIFKFFIAKKDAEIADKVENKENSQAGGKKGGGGNMTNVRIYHDDTMKSFFRRPAFSPDGQLLVTPAGQWSDAEDAKPTNAAFVYNLRKKEPVVRLQVERAAIAVRFCPVLFELRKTRQGAIASKMIDLPYRMVFAVATEDAVVIYDTQQTLPLALAAGIHYHQLSDLTWSKDGRLLLVASTDGYCSLVSFDEGELGIPYNDSCALPSVDSVWSAVEQTTLGSRKASSRASKTKAMAQNTKEIAAHMEAKASKDADKAAGVVPAPMTNAESEADKPVVSGAATPSDEKRRIPLMSMTSSTLAFSTTAPSKPAPPVAKPEARRVQLQSAPLTKVADPKPEVKPARRVMLTSLSVKKDDEEPMET